MANFKDVKEGDTVIRLLSGLIPMELKVTKVTEEFIFCGDWTFDINTGGEVDTDLGWDGVTVTGSYLKK